MRKPECAHGFDQMPLPWRCTGLAACRPRATALASSIIRPTSGTNKPGASHLAHSSLRDPVASLRLGSLCMLCVRCSSFISFGGQGYDTFGEMCAVTCHDC